MAKNKGPQKGKDRQAESEKLKTQTSTLSDQSEATQSTDLADPTEAADQADPSDPALSSDSSDPTNIPASNASSDSIEASKQEAFSKGSDEENPGRGDDENGDEDDDDDEPTSYEEIRRTREHLLDLVRANNLTALKEELAEMNESEIALFLEDVENKEEETAMVIFRLLPKEMAADVFSHLSSDAQTGITNDFTDLEKVELLNNLFSDDAVDYLEEMPASIVKNLVSKTNPAKRDVLNRLLLYHDDDAGSIMTNEYLSFKREVTVVEAINIIRKTADTKETIYVLYITDATRVLEGVLSVRDLLLARDDQTLAEIMDTNVIKVDTKADREEVANMFDIYDFLALPVVDQENRLVGIITVDDALDIIHEETSEDFAKMAALTPSEQPYFKTTILEQVKRRLPWLALLMVLGVINERILSGFQHVFAAAPMLVGFMPMLTDTGGNAGAQSSTIMIRGMSLNEISAKDIWKVCEREFATGFVVAIGLVIVSSIRIWLTYQDFHLMATVNIALFIIIIMAKVVGGVLPILAKMCKMDPAIMASPLITTIVDNLGLLIYCLAAEILLLEFPM